MCVCVFVCVCVCDGGVLFHQIHYKYVCKRCVVCVNDV